MYFALLLLQLLDEIEKLKKRITELEAELKEALKYKYKCQVSHFVFSYILFCI